MKYQKIYNIKKNLVTTLCWSHNSSNQCSPAELGSYKFKVILKRKRPPSLRKVEILKAKCLRSKGVTQIVFHL